MGSHTPEIITLQTGHYANFVGTHWWNIQEASFVYDPTAKVEIDHGVLFREGETFQRESTFTPRLLAVDLRGSLGGLRRRGRLYGEEAPPAAAATERLWHGDTVRHKEEPGRPGLLQRLDGTGDPAGEKDVCQTHDGQPAETPEIRAEPDDDKAEPDDPAGPDVAVKVWSDFLGTHLHPWSVHILTEHLHDNASDPFDVFGYGEAQYSREDFRDGFEDRLRAYAEECDHLAGFHVVSDGCDGFGGVAAGALAHLSDEFPRRPALLVPLQPPAPARLTLPQIVHRTVNAALTLDAGGRLAALSAPLSVQERWSAPLVPPSLRQFEHLEYGAAPYEGSALLAAALDTVTAPWRRKQGPVPLYEVTAALTGRGRTVAAAGLALPLGTGPGDRLADWLDAGSLRLQSLTPGVAAPAATGTGPDVWSGCAVLRGVPEQQTRSDSDPWQEAVAQWPGRQLACRLREPLRTAAPFPFLFTADVGPDGLVRPRQVNATAVSSAPAAGSLVSSRSTGECLASLGAIVGRYNVSKFHRFAAGGLEADDFSEVRERLSDLAACYRPDTDAL
ncbi:protein misato homolog 1-like [Amphibalanus amphitrite]|uniref:protein misato homolog 1-like n=1 Tax=Amphibalanus amphitrite TaxID=1232801 RepID=UPI001C91D8FE|nr:protein misato homolog 1-like [Amphibalanus amphitrite]